MKEKIKERKKEISARIKEEVSLISAKIKRAPVLLSVKIGEDPSSDVYRKSLHRLGQKLGVEVVLKEGDESQGRKLIEEGNKDGNVDGIIIHCLRENLLRFTQILAPEKDVEGLSPWNLGRLIRGEEALYPATPLSVLEILDLLKFDPAGKKTLIIGRSLIVGKPLFLLLLRKHATITVAHSKTINLEELTLNSELIIVAAGRPALLKPSMVREATLVIDVGINVVDGRIVGDVDPAVGEKATLTPVPGGVGTFTSYMLFSNLIKSMRRRLEGETGNSSI